MSYESEFENEYKNYKDGFVQLLDELDEGRWAHEPDMRAELDEVYAEAAKTGELRNELRKQKGVLSGQMDVMEINLNYYKKQAAEYEAKAKAWDKLEEYLSTSPYDGIDMDTLKNRLITFMVESGESDEV